MTSNVWSVVFSILIGLFGIDVLVIFHELGHYFAAKIFHVFVEKVQIGLGPSLASYTGERGTQYSVGVVPYGAFCRMDVYSLQCMHPVKRVLIYLSGPLFNIILAIVCYTFYLGLLNTPISEAFKLSVMQCNGEMRMFLNAIGNMITGQAKIGATLSGWIKASINMGNITRSGFAMGFITGLETSLWLTASVSVSLAFANLIPIPALDGGNILITMIEWITRHEFSELFQTIIQLVGLILLLVVLPVVRFFF